MSGKMRTFAGESTIDAIKMIYLNDHIYDFDLETALGELSEQRRQQALRYRHELGQRTCVAAYLLLRQGLREEYDIEEPPVFEYGEHGKPWIVGHPEIHFNMSHCKEAAICILSNKPVGIDVESVDRCRESLIRYTMNDEEARMIAEAEKPEVAFTRLWTMKEAVVKRSGLGIRNDMKNVLKNLSSKLTTVVSLDERYVYSICE